MTTCYDFISVRLKNEVIQARPVAWDREIADGFGNDAKGEPVKPTEFHGTCPYCGNLVHFTTDDIYQDANNNDNVKCLICHAGNEAKEQVKLVVPSSSPTFIDPISEGLFDLEVDSDLLAKLDSTKAG